MLNPLIKIMVNKSSTLLIVLIFSAIATLGQDKINQLFFRDRLQPITEENVFKTEGYHNWCSSIIKGKDGKYHLFYSRWKKEEGHWLVTSEVAHAVSNNPAGPWEYEETAMESRGKGHWDAITVHNPKIKFFEGKYYLYYISTNLGNKDYTEEDLEEIVAEGGNHPYYKILRSNQRTGVAVSSSLNGPWRRMEQPLIEPSGPITTITVNPAITRRGDQKYYLIVKGDKPNEPRFIRNQALAVSDSPTGPFKMQQKPVIDYLDNEDMSLWYDRETDCFYGVFHAHKFIGIISSSDGVNWKKADVLMYNRVSVKGGELIKPDRLERPFVYVEDNEPKVLSLAVKEERGWDKNEAYIIFIPVK